MTPLRRIRVPDRPFITATALRRDDGWTVHLAGDSETRVVVVVGDDERDPRAALGKALALPADGFDLLVAA